MLLDDLDEWGFERCFAFTRSVGDHYLPAYLPIILKRKDIAYGQRERNFQLYRHGRHVEAPGGLPRRPICGHPHWLMSNP